MAAVTICSDFGAQKNKVWHCFHCFPSISHEVMGPDAMIFVFWMLSFKPTSSLSTFTFIKRLFSSSSLSAVRLASSACLRLLIFLPAVLIPACHHCFICRIILDQQRRALFRQPLWETMWKTWSFWEDFKNPQLCIDKALWCTCYLPVTPA